MLHRHLLTSASLAILTLSTAVGAMAASSGELPKEVQEHLAKKDFKQAAALLSPLSDKGDVTAQIVMATFYRFGLGVPKDTAKAIALYGKAAESGDDAAQYNLGVIYLTGEGTAQDFQKAKDLFQKAAEQGNPLAQSNLAGMYVEGKGVEKDPKKALEWAMKAAKQGDAMAQSNLAKMYKLGIGTEKSDKEASKWLRRAMRPRSVNELNGTPVAEKVKWGDVQFPTDAQEEQLNQADTLLAKAKASADAKDFDGALASIDTAIQTWKDVYGANDPWVSQGLGLKAQCYLAKNDLEKASAALKDSLTVLETTKMAVSPKDLLMTVSLYGTTLKTLKKDAEAEALGKKYQGLLQAARAAQQQAQQRAGAQGGTPPSGGTAGAP